VHPLSHLCTSHAASYIAVKAAFDFPDTEMFVTVRMGAGSIRLLTVVSPMLFVVILTAF